MKKFGKLFATLLASGLFFAGCGGDSSNDSATSPSEDALASSGVDYQISSADVLLSSSSMVSEQTNLSSNALVSSSSEPYVHVRGFNKCQFNFGAAWSTDKERDSTNYAGLDYIAVWLGDNDFYNGFEERMVKMCTEIGATPMIYAYVIAEFDKDHGIEDCDISTATMTHCSNGAQMIREYFADSILYRYKAYALGMREQLQYRLEVDPDTYKSIWLIEPDFYQYSESASIQKGLYSGVTQQGGGIPDSMMGVYFKQIVDTIRAYLPAAEIAIDISPWIGDKDTANVSKWYSNFDMSIVDYAGTSGGSSLAISEKIVSSNTATWQQIYEVTGKPILADAGYGTGGSSNGHKVAWDQSTNILNRMANGVVGIMQMNADNDYPVRADTIRPQLNYTYPWCEN